MRVLRTVLTATLLLFAIPAPARASFHFMMIREVFAGTSASPNAIYVELQMYAAGQRFVSGKLLRFYDAGGNLVHTETFSADVANGANQQRILIATPGAETLFGVQADLELSTPALDGAGGRVCFEDEDGGFFEKIDCVSFGSYTGDSAGTGTPFNAPEGIPAGATMMRDASGGADSTKLDSGDDTNNSANDFEFAGPSPTNNADSVGTPPGAVLNFSAGTFSEDENGGPAVVAVGRTGAYGSVLDVSYATADGTATAGSDYTATSGDLSFNGADTIKTFAVDITDDSLEEGNETVLLRIRTATGDTVFGPRINATLTITDDEAPPDTTAPVSEINRPEHRGTYRAGRMRTLRGIASDASTVDRVEIALRMTRTNGSCRWLAGAGFVNGACGDKRWRAATGTTEWTFRLPEPLPKTIGTRARHYTLYTRAVDEPGNVESAFEAGRNANRFEIK